jgi:hypothetical protein
VRSLTVPTELGELKPDEQTVEIRFVNTKGQTEVWIYRLAPQLAGAWALNLPQRIRDGAVWEAYIDEGVDARLATQAGSIERLTPHLEYHHNELRHQSFEDCDVLSGRVLLP